MQLMKTLPNVGIKNAQLIKMLDNYAICSAADALSDEGTKNCS